MQTQAQQRGITRAHLQRHDLGVPGREVVQARVDLASGVTVPKHSHPGEEIVYVIEGVLEYQVEGEPPETVKAGEVLFIPAEAIHTVKNIGCGNGRNSPRTSPKRGSRSSCRPSELR